MAEQDLPGHHEGDESLPSMGLTDEMPATEVVVQRLMAIVSRQTDGQDQFIDRLDNAQITKVLDQAESSDQRIHARVMAMSRDASWNFRVVVLGGLILVIGLAWLFLYYGNADQLREITALLLGAGVGGAGATVMGFTRAGTRGRVYLKII